MAVKSLTVTCDWCETEAQVEFDKEDTHDDFFTSSPLPDQDWYHVEGNGEEKDYCSRECLSSDLL